MQCYGCILIQLNTFICYSEGCLEDTDAESAKNHKASSSAWLELRKPSLPGQSFSLMVPWCLAVSSKHISPWLVCLGNLGNPILSAQADSMRFGLHSIWHNSQKPNQAFLGRGRKGVGNVMGKNICISTTHCGVHVTSLHWLICQCGSSHWDLFWDIMLEGLFC